MSIRVLHSQCWEAGKAGTYAALHHELTNRNQRAGAPCSVQTVNVKGAVGFDRSNARCLARGKGGPEPLMALN
jgi:hypothetical protein